MIKVWSLRRHGYRGRQYFVQKNMPFLDGVFERDDIFCPGKFSTFNIGNVMLGDAKQQGDHSSNLDRSAQINFAFFAARRGLRTFAAVFWRPFGRTQLLIKLASVKGCEMYANFLCRRIGRLTLFQN